MHTVIEQFPDTGFNPLLERRQITRVAAGIALSLAAHALLLSLYRQPQAPALPAATNEPLTVRLQEAAPRMPPPPVAEPLRPSTPPKAQARPSPRTPRRIIAVPAQPAASDHKPFTVEPPPPANVESTPAPRFNLDAARSTARSLANAPDPARVGTALERLPPPPLQTESRLERGIKAAKRPDCKDGVPGGLLAPLYLALDKKDSGCKW